MKKNKMKALPALLLALLLLIPAGCGGNGKTSEASGGSSMAVDSAPAYAPEAPMPTAAPNMPAEAEGWASDSVLDEGFSVSGSSSGSTAKPTDFTQKIIYSASLSIETLEFDASVAALERLANEMDGFIESSNVSGDARRQADGTTKVVDRWANYVIRVPAGRLEDATHRAGDLGSITNSSMNADNITSMFTDQEARKHSLEVQEERLLDMLSRAEDVDTLIILESRLSEVRYEIESIERMLRNWQNQVDYSTLSVYLREVEKYTPTAPVQRSFGERLSDAFGDGWAGFCDGLEDFVLLLVEALPVLVILLIVNGAGVVVLVLCLRRARRKKAAKAEKAEEKTGEEPQPDETEQDEKQPKEE